MNLGLKTKTTYGEDGLPNGYELYRNCIVTNKHYSVTVTPEEIFDYNEGYTVQEAMSRLSADDREFLISGISPEGWSRTWNPKDGEEKQLNEEQYKKALSEFVTRTKWGKV